MNTQGFVDKANQRHHDAWEFLSNWRKEAREDYAFVAGDQWEDDDKAILEDQKRPPITFNYSEKMVDAVVGAEVSSRNEVSYLPRGLEDSPLAELWTNAARWVRDECNAEDEETDSFRDNLICGMGWTSTAMDYETDLAGLINVSRVDPLEMLYDPAAIKIGLRDRRYHFHDFWSDKDEVERHWPNSLLAQDIRGNDQDSTGVVKHGHGYDGDQASDRDCHKDQVQLRFYECVEREAVHRVAGSGSVVELSPKEFGTIRDRLDELNIPHVKQFKKVYYRAFFADDTLLGQVEQSPCQDGFTYNCMTAKRDRNKNYWYGIVRVMKDPQRWANKWLSQILHIINTNAKGGLLAELGAFRDPQKAQDEWAEPDSITLLNEGGLKKVLQKNMASYPSGLDKLMTFALESLPMVTGINLEALGLANREQAGVLEAQRKQAAYGLLSPLFDSLRRYRKEQGKVLLYFIKNYISDGRLIRIGGPDSAQYVPLTKAPDAIEYDIIVDQAPNAPDTKQKTWESLIEILPAMMKAGMPIPPDLLDYTPLPASLAAKWKKFIAENPPMGQDQMQQMQQQAQQAMQENEQLKQQNQQIKMDKTADYMKVQHDMKLDDARFALEKQRMSNQMILANTQAANDHSLSVAKANNDAAMKEKQVRGDLRIKAMTAQVGDDGEGGGGQPVGGLLMDDGDFKQAMQQMMQMMAQSQQQNQEAMQMLAQALSKPRKLVSDPVTGRPIGSMPVDTIQ